jgi:hypothetical protein
VEHYLVLRIPVWNIEGSGYLWILIPREKWQPPKQC